tara:strand:+ start:497 stop:1462 length:966 start_codon:yes stop_codon:yes gene_type:complete
MPKYIKKRKRCERIAHGFFYGNKYKTCYCCNEWKLLDQFGKDARARDGKQSCCKSCKKKKEKQRRKVMKEQLEKAREAAPTGFLVCLFAGCTVKGLQPLDQFIGPHVRNDEPTRHCLTCRNKVKELDKQRQAECQKVWDDWRKTHPCVKCMNDPNYEHNYLFIEADHLPEFEKVEACSEIGFWSHSQRGPRLQKAELMKCQASCRFHHRLVTQQRNHDNGNITKQASILRKRKIINAEKHKRGCCLKCERPVKEGEECGFDFDHRDPNTKFKYKGKRKNPTKFVDLPDAIFNTQWPLEQAKCDLLCANCHRLKKNRDGYRK